MTAWHHWSAMHAWWCARRDEREPIGKPWAPKGSPKKSETVVVAPRGDIATVSDPFDGLTAPPPKLHMGVLGELSRACREAPKDKLRDAWPEGVPTPKDCAQWTVEHEAPIRAALRKVDFEGPPVDPSGVAAVRKAFEALEPSDKAWVESLLREARTAGVPFGALGDNPTLRRFELGRACVKLGTYYAESNDHVVALITLALGEEPQPAPLGALLGSLSAAEAVKFAHVVDAFVDGQLLASFSDAGVLRFAFAS